MNLTVLGLLKNFRNVAFGALAASFFLSQPAVSAVIQAPGATWEYTFTDPTGDPSWNTTTGLGGIWSSGDAPFGNTNGGDFGFVTLWDADGTDGDDLWVRKTIDFTGFNLASLTWDLGVDNGFKLYLNGVQVGAGNDEGFTSRWEYSGTFGGAPILPGLNVLAVALEDHGGATAFDMQVSGDANETPEPAAILLIGSGLAVLGILRRRR